MEHIEKAFEISKYLEENGAKNLELLDISKKSKDIKVLIICSLACEEKVKVLTSKILAEKNFFGMELLHKDGISKGQWCVLDYGDLLLEIFCEEAREKYNLEKLWKDGKNKLISQTQISSKKVARKTKKQ